MSWLEEEEKKANETKGRLPNEQAPKLVTREVVAEEMKKKAQLDQLAKQKKLELAIAGSPGWSVTGGPWVEPKDGMKKYVWSMTTIDGGATYNGKLNLPPGSTGKIQDAKMPTGGLGSSSKKIPDFYADAAVIAFKQPVHEKTLQELQPAISSSGGSFNLKELTDGSIAKSSKIPFKRKK